MVLRDMEYHFLMIISICLMIMGACEIAVRYILFELISSHSNNGQWMQVFHVKMYSSRQSHLISGKVFLIQKGNLLFDLFHLVIMDIMVF